MEEKISVQAIDEYSRLFASRLADSFFENKEKINGREILSLCDINQVNLLVIKELMHHWNRESEKWKSSFFDYEAPQVKESMSQFHNTLSNHILISKVDFLPLLRTATAQTLHILFAPYDFFSDTLDAKGNGLMKTDHLKNETRYLRINRAPLDKLIEKLDERKIEIITGNEAFAMLDHILEEMNFSPEDIDGYVTAFSKVATLPVAALYERKEPQPKQPKTSVPESAPVKPKVPTEESKKIKVNIIESLTINQKFMFTKMLFAGDFQLFSKALEQVDAFESLSQAIDYFAEHYPHWDHESEAFEEFITVVQRKFTSTIR
ncbi:MAG: hypothetical protein JST69_14290 [Bacteroidetes bacterium]|nr:hypothetical protein [Bacteroidota bacterium]